MESILFTYLMMNLNSQDQYYVILSLASISLILGGIAYYIKITEKK